MKRRYVLLIHCGLIALGGCASGRGPDARAPTGSASPRGPSGPVAGEPSVRAEAGQGPVWFAGLDRRPIIVNSFRDFTDHGPWANPDTKDENDRDSPIAVENAIRCTQFATGILEGVDEGQMQVFAPGPGEVLESWRWSRVVIASGKENASRSFNDWTYDETTTVGDELLLARANDGKVAMVPSGHVLPQRPIFGRYRDGESKRVVFGAGSEIYEVPDPERSATLRRLSESDFPPDDRNPGFLMKVWTDGTWLLRAASVSVSRLWDVSTLSGDEARMLAVGAVGLCGNPMVDGHALGIDWPTGDILRIPFEGGRPVERMTGVPLTKSYCLAGEGGLIAVTGASGPSPAVALYSDGQWQVVPLPGSLTIGEPHVVGGRVFVAMPASDVLDPGSEPKIRRGAGGVFVLAKDDSGQWQVEHTILADKPLQRSWLGLHVGYSAPYLVLGFMLWPAEPVEAFVGDSYICRAELN